MTTAVTPPVFFRARWVFPVATPPIQDGEIVVQDGRIVHLGKRTGRDRPGDSENLAIIPALVNAHTHLEYSNLERPIGTRGMAFPEWIRAIVTWKRAHADDVQTLMAVTRGLADSLESGAGTLGEISNLPSMRRVIDSSHLGGIAFLEQIGLAANRCDELLAAARRYVTIDAESHRVRPGISPHAPYTVHPDLLAGITRMSVELRFPVAMHLAESYEELQLLRDQSGPFAELLKDLNAWVPDAIHPGVRPLDYLRTLAEANRALVIHGNYLDDEEIQFLGERRQRMSVVYCPRTHDFFGHRSYPLSKLLTARVRVAMGTDSRASNPDLSMWNELRFAIGRHGDVSPAMWLQIATLHGAQALGLECHVGSLEAGKDANFVVLNTPSADPRDPWQWLTDPNCHPARAVIRGQTV